MSQTNENTILRVLSGKTANNASALAELKAITAKYPAFGVAKYLLAKQMLQRGGDGIEKYTQNAVLYFPDPFWFHFKLNEERLMQDETFLQKRDGLKTPEEGNSVESDNSPTEIEDIAENEPELTVEEPKELEDAPFTVTPAQAEILNETVKNEDAEDSLEAPVAASAEPIEVSSIEINTLSDGILEDTIVKNNEPIPLQITEPIATGDSFTEEHAEVGSEIELSKPPLAKPTPAEGFAPQPKFVFDETAEDGGNEDGEDADEEMETLAQPFNNDRITAVLQEQLADYNKPVTENTPVPVESEPYHTIDYFASQGIKLSLEQQAQDHLSVKVKKFTDWLKQMKRIAPQPTDLGIDEAAEHRVKNIAADSNELKEVVTETMAEVLVKQGMKEKAIEVYEKLSFLYPAKSAYFASQIEHLKRT